MPVQKPVSSARRRELGAPGAPTGRIAARGGSGVLAREAGGAAAETVALACVAGALIVAGGLVAAVNSATPFAHGSWLAAYLVLAGGVAQLALGAAPVVLPAPVRSTRLTRAQIVLWNVGIAIVAVGVLADALAVVVAGSVLVLAALAAFAYGGGPARPKAAARVMIYRLVILVLAVSVAIGSVLAGASLGA